MDLQKLLFGTQQYVSRTDTEINSPDPDPSDLWLFTDPDAREEYSKKGRMEQLERDIRFEIMRDAPWKPEELLYKKEIRRLLQDGMIADKGTYWYRSPHPTVYRAQRSGKATIFGWEYSFQAGDDLTFQCRMERDEASEDTGPMLVARLAPAENAVLCGDMSSAMRGMNKKMSGME